MPWEITIGRPDGGPLGGGAAVSQQIADALPGVVFRRGPGGPERIAAARALGIEFPEAVRRHFERRPAGAEEQAAFEGDGFGLTLYGFGARPLRALHVEVRGDGDPVPALAALCRPNGWVATDDASGRPVVDPAGAAVAAEGWESFRAARDRATRGTRPSGGGAAPDPPGV